VPPCGSPVACAESTTLRALVNKSREAGWQRLIAVCRKGQLDKQAQMLLDLPSSAGSENAPRRWFQLARACRMTTWAIEPACISCFKFAPARAHDLIERVSVLFCAKTSPPATLTHFLSRDNVVERFLKPTMLSLCLTTRYTGVPRRGSEK